MNQIILKNKKIVCMFMFLISIVILVIGIIFAGNVYSNSLKGKIIVNGYIELYNEYDQALNIQNQTQSVNNVINVMNKTINYDQKTEGTNIALNNPILSEDMRNLIGSNAMNSYINIRTETEQSNIDKTQLKSMIRNSISDALGISMQSIKIGFPVFVIGLGILAIIASLIGTIRIYNMEKEE